MEHVELTYVLRELQRFVLGKVQKIFHHEDVFVLQLYKAEEGKSYLVIRPPSAVYLTLNKPPLGDEPSALCVRLRNMIDGASLKEITQAAGERILRLVFTTKTAGYHVYVELFGKGNIVVCDGEDKILIPWQSQTYTARLLTKGEAYQLPPPRASLFDLSDHEFFALLSSLDKNISTTLAKRGLGAKYAREICIRAEVDPLAERVTRIEQQRLHEVIQELLKLELEPAVIEENGVAVDIEPFTLASVNGERVSLESFSLAIEKTMQWKRTPSKYEKEIEKVNAIISAQQKNMHTIQDEIVLQTRKAETIYEHYEMVKEVLDKAKEDVNLLKKIPVVKKIDLKEKTVTLVLE